MLFYIFKIGYFDLDSYETKVLIGKAGQVNDFC